MIKKENNYPAVVVAIIQDEKERFLVSQRSWDDKIAPGQWQNPGGKVEAGESHYQALKREVKEETDLEVKSVSDLLFRFRDDKNKFEIYFYKVETTGQPQVKEPEKQSSAWIYLTLNELHKKSAASGIVPALAEFIRKLGKLSKSN